MPRADIPEFEINVDSAGRPTFAHPGQGYAWLRQFAGTLIVGQFYGMRDKRSARQNRAIHAMLQPWCAATGTRIDDLKRELLEHVFGTFEHTSPITGQVYQVLTEPHTSALSVGQFVTLIDAALELAAGRGVWLLSPDEYTRAKAAAEKQAARAARKVAA